MIANNFLAKDIDKEYFDLLTLASKNKIKVLCYDCKFSSKGIKLNNKINIILMEKILVNHLKKLG